jgi:hypothetical protein
MRIFKPTSSAKKKLQQKLGKKYNHGVWGYGTYRKPYKDYNPKEPEETEFKGKVQLKTREQVEAERKAANP